jgi:hypothetical protein
MSGNEYVIDMSNVFVYQAFSNGYSWMTNEMMIAVSSTIKNSKDIKDAINNKDLWNMIGTNMFRMPYIEISPGVFDFIIPSYSDINKNDIRTQELSGKIIKSLIKENDQNAFLNIDLRFILYNDFISVDGVGGKGDVNTANIIFNVLTVFMLQTIKRHNGAKHE